MAQKAVLNEKNVTAKKDFKCYKKGEPIPKFVVWQRYEELVYHGVIDNIKDLETAKGIPAAVKNKKLAD